MTSADAAMGAATDELAETITRTLHKHHPMDGDYPSVCYRCAELYPCPSVVTMFNLATAEAVYRFDQLGILDVLVSAVRARRQR